jgi:hypothetical protein
MTQKVVKVVGQILFSSIFVTFEMYVTNLRGNFVIVPISTHPTSVLYTRMWRNLWESKWIIQNFIREVFLWVFIQGKQSNIPRWILVASGWRFSHPVIPNPIFITHTLALTQCKPAEIFPRKCLCKAQFARQFSFDFFKKEFCEAA